MGGTYKPGPRNQLEDVEWPGVLGRHGDWDIHVHARTSSYRGQIRDFAITVWAVADTDRHQVECVDCCEGELHRHRLARSAPTERQADRHRICELNRGDEAIVHKEFDMQYDWILANWEALVRRWATT